jgi:hypothetical protein
MPGLNPERAISVSGREAASASSIALLSPETPFDDLTASDVLGLTYLPDFEARFPGDNSQALVALRALQAYVSKDCPQEIISSAVSRMQETVKKNITRSMRYLPNAGLAPGQVNPSTGSWLSPKAMQERYDKTQAHTSTPEERKAAVSRLLEEEEAAGQARPIFLPEEYAVVAAAVKSQLDEAKADTPEHRELSDTYRVMSGAIQDRAEQAQTFGVFRDTLLDVYSLPETPEP